MHVIVAAFVLGRCQTSDCDFWNVYRIDCTTLEVVYGCKCAGCFCHHRSCDTSADCFPVCVCVGVGVGVGVDVGVGVGWEGKGICRMLV